MMVRQHDANIAQRAFADAMAASMPPPGIDTYKLDRLLELRAVINSLRAERNHDPLLVACGLLSNSGD